jgi:regulator of sigma E protease
MNLIFAVIFGMVAYRMGVTYTPTVVGSTSPGLSAWEVGLQSGDRIVQMGRDGEPSEHLRFTNDMMVKVMMTGANRQLDLLVDRYTAPGEPEKAPEWITVNLSNPQKEMQGRPIIGIGMPATNVVASNEELQTLFGHLPAYQVESPLQQGERIVAVDGVPVSDYAQLSRELAQRIDQPITLTLERPAAAEAAEGTPERRDVTVAPTPGRELGLHLTAGPIVSIQQGSIAEQAGLKVGDRLLEINGETVGDPMRIPDQLRRRVGTPVELRVARPGQDEPLVVSLVPRQPTMYHSASGLGQALPVEAAGFAFTIENRVAGIVPGSAAATSGIQVGDVVQAAEFEAANEQAAELESELFRSKQPIELGEEELSWPRVHDRLRFSQPETRVLLTYQRGDQLKTATLLPASTADWHYADRGLNLMTMEEVHQVEQWGTAFTLGVRETYESMRQVYFILFRLISGQLSPKNLGGPASIATMAGMEASESTARLLVFLTLLSANLAVVNFLPIPVLDGGHAMFLLYEGIFRKPINERVAFGLTMVGFCFVLGLMLFVIGLDFWRFSGLSG